MKEKVISEPATKSIRDLKSNKKYIICGLTILTLVIFTIVYLFFMSNKLSPMETQAVTILNDYKTKLKNPSSLQVFEIRYNENYSKDNELYYKFYIDCSGQNSWGGSTRSIVYYTLDKNGNFSFIGNDNEADRTISKYTSSDDVLEITIAKLIQKEWNELKESEDGKLNVSKIMKKVE